MPSATHTTFAVLWCYPEHVCPGSPRETRSLLRSDRFSPTSVHCRRTPRTVLPTTAPPARHAIVRGSVRCRWSPPIYPRVSTPGYRILPFWISEHLAECDLQTRKYCAVRVGQRHSQWIRSRPPDVWGIIIVDVFDTREHLRHPGSTLLFRSAVCVCLFPVDSIGSPGRPSSSSSVKLLSCRRLSNCSSISHPEMRIVMFARNER